LARSELAEETGLRAAHLRHLGHLHGAYGFCSQGFDVFLATGLSAGTPNREPTEQDMTHRFVPDDEVVAMISAGLLTDGASVAALALYFLAERPSMAFGSPSQTTTTCTNIG
jgi:8-oxo-dGTP pyrophosphatase MutT (NUDIX family)